MPRYLLLFSLAVCFWLPAHGVVAEESSIPLEGHVPTALIKKARDLGVLAADKNLDLTFSLPLRNRAHLKATLRKMYDPQDPAYGHYLTPKAFRDRYAPRRADTLTVIREIERLGLKVRNVSSNRLLVEVSAPASVIQRALGVELHQYEYQGHWFHASPSAPRLSPRLARQILGISGLDTAAKRKPYHLRPSLVDHTFLASSQGSGPNGGLSPSDIASAYNLQSIPATGDGQVLALFQMDGFNPSDIETYRRYFNLPVIPVEPILVSGASGVPGSDALEVTLDIELQMATAPGASRILVYEGPNTDAGVLAVYNRIATDNRAKSVSTSWGLSELDDVPSFLKQENQIFMQMAAQGQTLFAASGDAGAYDTKVNGKPVLSVDDPASQPYVTGVGGTKLFITPSLAYAGETVWSNTSTQSGGGGGVSSVWPLPTWQQSLSGAQSSTMRNVPDVSLNADPQTGYSVFSGGTWAVMGGTSCASPIWSGFMARVNQQRILNGLGVMGYFNPTLYRIGQGDRYSLDFHDITQGNNLYYAAGPGYDNASGWGSFQGAALFQHLSTPVKSAETINPGPTPALIWGQSAPLTPTASSGLPVTIISNTPLICSITGAVVTGISPGDCLLTLSQAGSATFQPAPDVVMDIPVTPPVYPAPLVQLTASREGAEGTVVSDPVGIRCGSFCAMDFTRRTKVVLTAIPGPGATFSRWRGACTGRQPVCTIRLQTRKTVTAVFR